MRFISLLILIGMMITGCQINKPSEKELELLKKEKQHLQDTVELQNKQIEWLKETISQQEQQLQPNYHDNQVLKEYPCLNKFREGTKWTKMTISRYEGDQEQVTIEDPQILESMNNLLYILSVGEVSFPSGYHSDVGQYTYQFYDKDQVHEFNVVSRGVIEAGKSEQFFEVDPNIHMIGKAFMPKPFYVQDQGLIAKMANSGAMKRGNQYVMFDAFRIQSKLNSLHDAIQMSSKPDKLESIIETYTFYYFGEQLMMDVYENEVHLHSDREDEWYYYEEAGILLNVEPG